MADLDNMLGESFYAHNPMKYSMEKTVPEQFFQESFVIQNYTKVYIVENKYHTNGK